MSIPMIFEFRQLTPGVETSSRVRVVDIDGQPWFVGADICSTLDIRNTSDAIATLDEDEKGIGTVDTLGAPQSVTVISEWGKHLADLNQRAMPAHVSQSFSHVHH